MEVNAKDMGLLTGLANKYILLILVCIIASGAGAMGLAGSITFNVFGSFLDSLHIFENRLLVVENQSVQILEAVERSEGRSKAVENTINGHYITHGDSDQFIIELIEATKDEILRTIEVKALMDNLAMLRAQLPRLERIISGATAGDVSDGDLQAFANVKTQENLVILELKELTGIDYSN